MDGARELVEKAVGSSVIFFFSSRRRHTRFDCDWSSDVCSSDLHAVIFDVSTDRGIRSGNQSLTEIMYGLFLQSLGYAKDLDLSELEIGLEEKEIGRASCRERV